ncbi:sensor domain-containing diguanylate cyclase [Hyphomonas sp.]|uniref:sensor domain-containing diguanylate cyclase n=1 Tax=Hyphomonas sp. TaxID=87 RepID=UPI0025BEC89A|nr:sensor domain-containing diguanylate cyclase [Hyphomonas sp.]
MIYPPPQFEQQKSEVLQRYRILNGSEVHVAGQIAQTTALALGVPVVIASLNERYRTWYQAAHGAGEGNLERFYAFSSRANLSDSAFALSDVREDPHFASDPAVSGHPPIVFFAGAPLRDPDGKRFGSLCLIDHQPKEFGESDLRLLESFAGLVSQDICVRSAARYAVRDLIEAEHDKCDLFDMAMTDPLTKALNRRAFFRFAEREVLRASRHAKPLTAIMFDIDHFKRVNDVHGHGVGDEVLTRLVQCVLKNIRDEDLLGRLGGEEFALVLPETEPLRAAILANRLRDAIKELSFPGKTGPFSITISAGISEPGFADIDIQPALERADAALYRAKQNGRNRVELAPLTSGGPTLAVA